MNALVLQYAIRGRSLPSADFEALSRPERTPGRRRMVRKALISTRWTGSSEPFERAAAA